MKTNIAEANGGKALEEQTAVCLCHFCGTWITFSPTQAGQLVNCANCLMETVLHHPDNERPYAGEKFRLEVRRISWETSELGSRFISGEVINRSPCDLDWARVEFSLFDGSGIPLGVASDSLLGFPASGTWHFKAPVHNPHVVRASLPMFFSEYGRLERKAKVTSAPPKSADDFERRKPRYQHGKSEERPRYNG